jgi:hypothetical protein
MGKQTEEQKTGARLGSLLLISELVTEEQMAKAMEIASALSLPLGRAFVMMGILTSNVIVAAVEMQSMLRDKLLDIQTIKTALPLVKNENISAGAALAKAGWTPKDDPIFTKLGELLFDASIINKEQLNEALRIASKSQLPLGRVLVINDFVNHNILWAGLNAQVLIRDGRINRKQAIAGLQAAFARQKTFEKSLMDQGVQLQVPPRKVKLGDILVMAGLLTEQDLLNALESCLVTDKPMGQVLIQKGLLTREAIDVALEIQELVGTDKVPPYSAGELLKKVVVNKKSLADAIAEIEQVPDLVKTPRLGDLLKRAGLVTDDDINEAIQLTIAHTSLLGKILVATGQIEELTLNNGLRCQYLVSKGLLTEDKAITALTYSQRMRCSIDDAFKDLGWNIDPNPGT